MIRIRPAEARGHVQLGWLDSRHSFSFGHYYDPDHMGFGPLRVINEDRVAPSAGFPAHGHRDMEILSYVLEGALEHRDSIGTGSVIRPGEVQRMTAGTGIRHSEYNPSGEEPVRFLQIWVEPERNGLAPSYEQKAFPEEERRNRLRLVASRNGQDGALTVHQDVALYSSLLDASGKVVHSLGEGRGAWLQLVRGRVAVNGEKLAAGDGAAVTQVPDVTIEGSEDAELLLFDLPLAA